MTDDGPTTRPAHGPEGGGAFPCLVTREEADPTIEAPECTHPDVCDQWWAECRWYYLNAVCMRPDGHDGDHGEWGSDNDVTLIFSDVAS